MRPTLLLVLVLLPLAACRNETRSEGRYALAPAAEGTAVWRLDRHTGEVCLYSARGGETASPTLVRTCGGLAERPVDASDAGR